MKKNYLLLLCILLLGLGPSMSNAQEAEIPTMFAVYEEFVSPSDMQKFGEVQNEAFELMKDLNFDMTFWAYRTDDNSFYWVLPLQNFGTLDGMFQKMMNFHKQMNDKGFDPDVKFRDLSTMRQSIIYWNQDLSYHPSGQMGQREEMPYCEWTFAYLKTGHEKEAAEAVKKYQEFYDGINESYEWDIYQVMFGHDTPCWILMVRAESELALRQLENDLGEKYQSDFQKMWQNFSQHVRKFENKKGWFLPKWSHNIPE